MLVTLRLLICCKISNLRFNVILFNLLAINRYEAGRIHNFYQSIIFLFLTEPLIKIDLPLVEQFESYLTIINQMLNINF